MSDAAESHFGRIPVGSVATDRRLVTHTLVPRPELQPVGGEIPVKLLSGSETDVSSLGADPVLTATLPEADAHRAASAIC